MQFTLWTPWCEIEFFKKNKTKFLFIVCLLDSSTVSLLSRKDGVPWPEPSGLLSQHISQCPSSAFLSIWRMPSRREDRRTIESTLSTTRSSRRLTPSSSSSTSGSLPLPWRSSRVSSWLPWFSSSYKQCIGQTRGESDSSPMESIISWIEVRPRLPRECIVLLR